MSGSVALTEEQRDIAGAPESCRAVVLAPAGTGKTEVVAGRLRHLIDAEGAPPGSGLLVLSFSNNAVGEIKRRTRLERAAGLAATISTFDAYATRLLATCDPDGDWDSAGYEGRLREAARLLAANEEAQAIVGEYRHVIVDEVQDLVGDRAEFVDALLRALPQDAGFTLLGDPAQGIFDFQLEGSASKTTSRELLRRILDMTPTPVVRALTTNFRGRSAAMSRIQRLGDELRMPTHGDELAGQAGEVAAALLALRHYPAEQAFRMAAGMARDHGTAAVLCRYNGQALLLSRAMREAGIDHRLKGESPDRWIGVWLAKAFRGYPFATISPGQFEERARGVVAVEEVEQVWRALKRAEGRGSRELHLASLVAALRSRRLSDELTTEDAKPITVSSVHRAKGLEWDLVFLCGIGAGDVEEGPSLAYVAMTRAREELYTIDKPAVWGLANRDQPDGRWTRRVKGLLVDIELLPDDTEWSAPAGLAVAECDPSPTQDYLEGGVHSGDRVDLCLISSRLGGRRTATYRIDHNGRAIGETTGLFSDGIVRAMGEREGPFPIRIEGARVRSVETVGGSSAAGIRAGLGASGLWLRPRLEGLATIIWGDRS